MGRNYMINNIKIGDYVGIGDASKYEELRGKRCVVWKIRTICGQNTYDIAFKDENGINHKQWVPESDLVPVCN